VKRLRIVASTTRRWRAMTTAATLVHRASAAAVAIDIDVLRRRVGDHIDGFIGRATD